MRAVPAEVAHRDVERETCPEARLLEDHRECPTPKRGIAGHGIALQRVGIVKERRHLGGGEGGDGEEVPHPRRDAGHRTAPRRRGAAVSAVSASATRDASWRIVSCLFQSSRGPLHLSMTGALATRTPAASIFAISSAVGSRYRIPCSAW